jgi:Flp pilus assembly protein TadG
MGQREKRTLRDYIRQFSFRRTPLCGERGQSLVEFALILPVLILLVMGTLDLAMGFRTYIALTNAAREGARWVSIHPTDQAGAEDRIALEADRVGLASSSYQVTYSPDKAAYEAGEQVTVTVQHDYELLFGAIPGQPEIAFEASATMVVLYDH